MNTIQMNKMHDSSALSLHVHNHKLQDSICIHVLLNLRILACIFVGFWLYTEHNSTLPLQDVVFEHKRMNTQSFL